MREDGQGDAASDGSTPPPMPMPMPTSTPTPAAADRLRAALAAEVAAYAAELDVDIEDIERATATDRAELAAAVARQHVDRLASFRDGVAHLLAEAVVEREAESVVAAASDRLAEPAGARPTAPSPSPDRSRVGVAVLASLVALLALTGGPQLPDHEATSTSRRADGRAVDLQHQHAPEDEDVTELAALEVRRPDALDEGSAGDDDTVRRRLDALLADRQDALLRLSIGTASSSALLEQIRALTRDLPRPLVRGLGQDVLRQGRTRSADDRATRSEQPRSQAPPPSPAPPPDGDSAPDDPEPTPAAQPRGEADEPPAEEPDQPPQQAEPDPQGSRPPPADGDEESLPPLVEEGTSLGQGAAGLGQR